MSKWGSVRYLLNGARLDRQPAAAAMDIGILSRYDRPQPSLKDYERLRPGCPLGPAVTEVIQ